MTTHIHIPDISPVIQYTADGSLKVFAFPFPIFWDSDLEVRVGTAILVTGFTVFGAGSSKGGAVVFASAPANGSRVTLRRKQTYARTDDFLDERAPSPHELNDAIDENVAAIQELAEQASRAVQLPLSADLSQPVALDLPSPEANKVLGWNGAANALVNIAQIDPSNVLHRDQNLADLADAVAARANLGLGSAATHANTDFATAAQGAKADSALQSSDIGASVQAHDADLDWLAANLSSAGKALVDDADASAQRATLGLATVAATGSYTDLSNTPTLGSAATLNVDTDATLAANSDSLLPSQKAVKAYVGNVVSGSAGLPTGAIIMHGASSPPSGYLLCDGSAVSRTTYAALFAAIGPTWGAGDGSTTFQLPDLRGRAPIGAGTGSGLTSRTLAATLGEEMHTLTTAEMPAHTHSGAMGGSSFIAAFWPDGTMFGTVSSTSAGGSAGGGGSHNTMQPSLVVNFIIKT